MQTTYRNDVYRKVSQIPTGTVATYGQIAEAVSRCTARMVGYALAGLSDSDSIPWHRVVNHDGRISRRGDGDGHAVQRRLLECEGVTFDDSERIDLELYRWHDVTSGCR